MVDKVRRKKLALHLRHLSTGQMTNGQFEINIANEITYGWLPEQYYRAKESKTDDPVIRPILEFSWFLYSDTHTHKLIGKKELSKKQLNIIGRIILFLHSELEYEWTDAELKKLVYRFSFSDFFKSVITLGQYSKSLKIKRKKALDSLKKVGDIEVWPFRTISEYQAQLNIPPFLNG